MVLVEAAVVIGGRSGGRAGGGRACIWSGWWWSWWPCLAASLLMLVVAEGAVLVGVALVAGLLVDAVVAGSGRAGGPYLPRALRIISAFPCWRVREMSRQIRLRTSDRPASSRLAP